MESNVQMTRVKVFEEKINTINNQFFAALDDFKKYYVYFNKNPEVDEFQHYYSNSKSQLQTLNKDLFLTTNDIGTDIDKLNTEIQQVSADIDVERDKFIELTDILTNIENTQTGSETLISDAKTLYNIRYVKNIEIMTGILVVSVMLRVVFNKQQ
jgi:hypothetical protein